MEWLGPVLGLVSQLAFFGLIAWVVVRLVGGRRDDEGAADLATSVRRLFEYGLLFLSFVLTAIGAVLFFQELLGAAGEDRDDGSTALALGLAFMVVAAPAYGLLLRHARRQLATDVDERTSFSWGGYLNLSLLVSLIVTVVTAQEMLEGITGVDDFELESVVPVVVWGGAWAMHWFWLKAAHGLPGDWHLAAGSLTGLVTLAVGAGGLVFVVGDEIYTRSVDQVPVGHGDTEIRSWAIAAVLGALVWWWHWLKRYVRAERTDLWHAYVVLIGSLGGLVATVVSAATIGYWTLVWFVGDPGEDLAREHFEYVPSVPAAFLLTGVVAWQYHRSVLQRQVNVERTEPLRAYDYLIAAAALVATIVGATVALVAVLEAITPEPARVETEIANRLILAATLTVIGGPLWWVTWSRIERVRSADPPAELSSIVRRIYLIALFGVGGIVVLVSLIAVLFTFFEDLFDGDFGGDTVRSARVGLSLVATISGVVWYHLGVFRSDRDALVALEPPPPPPPPPPGPLAARHLVLITPRQTNLADALRATGADLETWHRADSPTGPEVDVGDLTAQIQAQEARNVLVVVDDDGTTVIPLET